MTLLFNTTVNINLQTNKSISTWLTCCFLVFCGSVYAAEQEATQEELDAVTSAIVEINDWLNTANTRQSAAQQTLRDTELAISALNQSVAELRGSVATREQSLQSLREQQRGLENDRDNTQAIIEQLIVAAYVNGDSGFLKTILNQEDSSEASRMLHYTRLFSEYELDALETYQQTIDQLSDVALTINEELITLESQQSQLLFDRNQLTAEFDERNQALAALNNEITNRSAELEQLEMDREELQALLEEIARAMIGIRSFADVPPMDDAQGELPFPVDGQIVSRFGSTYGGGNLTRQGIFISTDEGTPVTAVHPGYVAFASWLQGQGLLVVLDHGEGFVTLYGGNQALAVEAGDWVARGEVIATSGRGNSNPDNADAGLYFELRREGVPQNPSGWLVEPAR